MPRMVAPLTDKLISTSKPKEKAYTLPDGKGLQLLISPDGRKSWEIVYLSPTTKKRRKSSFGIFPVVSLKEARLKRDEWQGLVRQGIDPIDSKREKQKEEKLHIEGNFKNVVTYWLADQEKRLKENTFTRKKALIENTVLKAFSNRNIDEIDHIEIIKILEVKAIQTPETSRRLFTYLNDLWQFACSRKLCKNNVIANIHKKSTLPKVEKVHYPKITDLEIFKELIDAVYNYHGHYSTKNALKFVLHLPLRASNLVNLKWSYVDFEKRIITIPRNEMKIKDKNMEDFILPMSDEVVNILKEQYLFTSNNDYVFVSANGNHINEETPNRALERLGFNDEKRGRRQRLHSFRGTFRSIIDTYQMDHKCSFEAKEKALDHSIGNATERAYTHKANHLKEMRILMDWWSNFILQSK